MGCVASGSEQENETGLSLTLSKKKEEKHETTSDSIQAVLEDKTYLSKLTDETKKAMAGACLVGKIWTDYWNYSKCDQCDEGDLFNPLYVKLNCQPH